MAANTWIGDYYVDGSGAWVVGKTKSQAGWIKSGNRWWYRHADGGYTKNGWEYINGQWYLFESAGWMLTGWQKVGGTWYYMYDSGAMAANTWIGSYYVNGSGAWVQDSTSYPAGDYNIGTVYGPSLTRAELDQVAAAVQQFVNSYDFASMNDYQKVRTAMSYLESNCSYADDWSKNRANTAWGALVYHKAQCSGYARGLKALCDAIGVGCYYVHADKNSSNPSREPLHLNPANCIQMELLKAADGPTAQDHDTTAPGHKEDLPGFPWQRTQNVYCIFQPYLLQRCFFCILSSCFPCPGKPVQFPQRG